MAEFNSKEYSRLRSIARKRIERAAAAGAAAPVHIPTVKGALILGNTWQRFNGFYHRPGQN